METYYVPNFPNLQFVGFMFSCAGWGDWWTQSDKGQKGRLIFGALQRNRNHNYVHYVRSLDNVSALICRSVVFTNSYYNFLGWCLLLVGQSILLANCNLFVLLDIVCNLLCLCLVTGLINPLFTSGCVVSPLLGTADSSRKIHKT